MAETMNAKLIKVEDAQLEILAEYDLIGFGSGIYNYNHHKTLIKFIENMPRLDKNVFIFFQLPVIIGKGTIISLKRS